MHNNKFRVKQGGDIYLTFNPNIEGAFFFYLKKKNLTGTDTRQVNGPTVLQRIAKGQTDAELLSTSSARRLPRPVARVWWG